MNIALLNDSFPPLIDGVANTVVNYAAVLENSGDEPVVVTPEYPGASDSAYNYPVIRYPGFDARELVGYVAGFPFAPRVLRSLNEAKTDILHSHCPIASTILARNLKDVLKVPLVMTYHTKFDIDIEKAIKGKLLQEGAIAALVNNIEACDEIWVVSDGAGQNLKSLGYKGDYIVMPNGVDVPKGRLPIDKYMRDTRSFGYNLPNNVPLFLFVGRIMWYKGLKIIIDALAAMSEAGVDYRMVFVGNGTDKAEVENYVKSLGLEKKIFFTGPIYERDVLCAWYCRADLFLFPSTFDTNGLVVREAAACGLASVLIKGSCAAEDTKDGINAYHISENAASLAVLLMKLVGGLASNPNRESEEFSGQAMLRRIGRNAQEELYISWEDAVHNARKRYDIVIENYKRGEYKKPFRPEEELFKLSGDIMDLFAQAQEIRDRYI